MASLKGEEQLAKEAAPYRVSAHSQKPPQAEAAAAVWRVVRKQDELLAAYQTARSEAQQAFGTPETFIMRKKFLEQSSSHRVFRCWATSMGKVIHLGEREMQHPAAAQKIGGGIAVTSRGRKASQGTWAPKW